MIWNYTWLKIVQEYSGTCICFWCSIKYVVLISSVSQLRMSILTDFANRIPELYLKASLEEKRMILATITESIEIDDDRQIVKVKLKPVFEYLRQLKLQDKKAFSASVEKLNGTLGGRSEKAKQALENNRPL